MTVVLVHGNPETDRVWDRFVGWLAEYGHHEVLRLSPPGFGAPVPVGWQPTMDNYRDWLIGELEDLAAPVDLVGHDWGGGHVLNVAMTRADLLRTWASDIVGAYDPSYVWHDLAQRWQRPGDGEAWVRNRLSVPPQKVAENSVKSGLDPAIADALSVAFDAAMGECVLGLYRSAAQPQLAELGANLPRASQRAGLAIVASADTFVGTAEQHRRAAELAGARVEVLPGLGHWWMTQDGGEAGAAALSAFWSSAGSA